MADESKINTLIELIKSGQNDGTASAMSLTPTKSAKGGKSKHEVDKLKKRIKQLETENKALKFDANETSRLFEEQSNSIAEERTKMQKTQKEIDSVHEEEKKEKEGINSKMSNYKTRIFFLESQVEELEKKNKEYETIRKKDKK